MRYVIIGNSAAGNAAAAAVRRLDQEGEVLILSDESYPAYYRPLMPFFIDDRVGYQSLLQDERATPQRVEIRLGTRVEEIDPDGKQLRLSVGKAISYDRLLVATGSSAIQVSLPGLNGDRVYVLRSMDDANAIRSAAKNAQRAVVIGGGRVGMKAAMALRRRGLEVTVVEQGDRLVPFQFDREAAAIVGRAIEAQGIRVLLNNSVTHVHRPGSRLQAVSLLDGLEVEADFLVVSVGIRPNTGLASDAKLKVNVGVVVDNLLQTTAPDIFAAGDVTETTDIITGESIVPATWTSAVETGRAAGHNMAGGCQEYPGTLAVLNSFVLAAVPTVSVGLIQPRPDQGCDVHAETRGESYRKLILKDRRLVGALMVGDIDGAGLYTALIKRQIELAPSALEALLEGRLGFAGWLQHVRAL